MFRLNGDYRGWRTGRGMLVGSGRHRAMPGGYYAHDTLRKMLPRERSAGPVRMSRIDKFLALKKPDA